MKNSVQYYPSGEDLSEGTSLQGGVSNLVGSLGAKMHSIFTGNPRTRRRNTRPFAIECLEDRVLMSATPWDSGDTVAAEVSTMETGGGFTLINEVLAHTTEDITISKSKPVYLLEGDGFVDVSAEQPLTMHGIAESALADVAIRLVMVANTNLDHRNQFSEAIIGQATMDGWGCIYQLNGSDPRQMLEFSYSALPDGTEIDMELTYDGAEITLTLSTNGKVFAEERLKTPIPHTRLAPALTDSRWNGEGTTVWKESTVSQGKMVEQPIPEVAAMETEALQSVFSDPALLDSLFTGSATSETTIVEPQMADTSEERLQALDVKKTALQLQTNDLMLEKADLETLIARQDTILSEVKQLDADADAILLRFAEQGDVENMRITPSLRVQAQRFQWHFTLNYSDMPEGYSAQIANQTIAIPEGSGSLRVSSLPRPNGNVGYRLNLLDVEGQQITRINTIKVYQGKISRVGTMNRTTQLPQISYIPELNAEDIVSPEQKTLADQHKIECRNIMDAAENELTRLHAESDAMQEQINGLERDKIPYSRMHVEPGFSGDQPTFLVHYASNRPQTYFELIMEGGGDYRRTVEHAGGEENGMVEINMRQLLQHNHNGGGNVKIMMYADSSKNELLDIFKGGNYSARHNRTSGETAGNWSDMETGRIIENPYTPTMTLASISGPNIIVAIQSPYDSNTITLDGGGLFDQKVVSHEGGTELQSIRLTFNADNPEGNYSVSVREGRNGMYVTGLGLHWDPATKELTMLQENPSLIATANTDAAFTLEAMRMQMGAQSSIDDIGINIASLRNVQDTHLYEASSFYIDTDDAKTYIDNSALKGHPDAGGIFHQTLSGYEAAVKESLRAAAQVAVAAWNGESQQDAREVFERNHGRVSLYRYLREFTSEFGIAFPSADVMLAEGIRLAEAQADQFIGNQAKEKSMYARESRRADQEGPGKLPGEISEAAYNHNAAIVAAIHGVNSAVYQSFETAWNNGGSGSVQIVDAGQTSSLVASEQNIETGGVVFVDTGMWDAAKLRDVMGSIDTQAFPDFSVLPDCPCTVDEIDEINKKNPGFFREEIWLLLQVFHTGATSGYRTQPINGLRQQCTYNLEGNLITEGRAAGTPDGDHTIVDHSINDVLPAIIVPGDGYHELRPPNQGKDCENHLSSSTPNE